jgi:hypothetical protein
LENGISTRSAKAGDSLYFHTAFPVTQNNQVVIPVGSYLRGSLLESKRPGRIKGHGEFRLRLESLILPNGYTVDLLAAPRSADTGGKETTDSEGKVTGESGKGKDAGTVATTTVTGAGIGASQVEARERESARGSAGWSVSEPFCSHVGQMHNFRAALLSTLFWSANSRWIRATCNSRTLVVRSQLPRHRSESNKPSLAT